MEKAIHTSVLLSSSNDVGNEPHLNSPPSKIRRVERLSLATGVPEVYVGESMEDEEYRDSKSEKVKMKSENAPGNSVNTKAGTSSVSKTDKSLDADYGVRVQGSFDIEGASVSDFSENINEANTSASLPSNKAFENRNDTKRTTMKLDSATNVIVQRDQGTQSPLYDLDENDIFNILGCNNDNETKTPEKLLQEYVDNEPSRLLAENFFRKAIPTYLKSSLEDINNKRSYNELMEKIENADFVTLMKTFTAMLERHNDNAVVPESPPGLNDGSEDAWTQTESSLPLQIPLGFSQETQTDEPQFNDVGVQGETDEDVMYQLHLDKLDESLFTDMRALSGRETNHEKKIPIIGKMLFNRFFSEGEILEGYKRKQCKQDGTETQAYDVKRVFIISQVIKSMLVEKKISAATFKSTIYENQGLEGTDYVVFNKTVMVDYANVQRNKIKKNQDRRRHSSAAN